MSTNLSYLVRTKQRTKFTLRLAVCAVHASPYTRIRYNGTLCVYRYNVCAKSSAQNSHTLCLVVPKRGILCSGLGHIYTHTYTYNTSYTHTQDVKMEILNGIGHIISFRRTLKHNFSANIASMNRPTVCLVKLCLRVSCTRMSERKRERGSCTAIVQHIFL